MKFATPYTYDFLLDRGEFFTEKSMTVPDQSYTIREILERFTSGIAPPLMRESSYDEDDYITDENIDYERNFEDITDALSSSADIHRNIQEGKQRAKELEREIKRRKVKPDPEPEPEPELEPDNDSGYRPGFGIDPK